MMLYLNPFLNKVTVEFRKYHSERLSSNHRAWKLRNLAWKTVAPGFAYWMTTLVPFKPLRYLILENFNRCVQLALIYLVSSSNTVPTDQIIRYPHKSGRSKYTFSIWAFSEESYLPILRSYFAFCRDYYREKGFRCDLVNVGYRISADTSSLFSYSFHGPVMTFDPVSTGARGWDDFLVAYNEFCSENGGIPLFNQTKWLNRELVRRAFGDRIDSFRSYRKRFDPEDRLLNEYFAEVLE